MKDLLERLYIFETEENPQLLPDRKNPKRAAQHTAYDEFFGTLSKEQKQLYFTYEKIRGELLTEENAVLYKCAFQSGFQFAQEIFTSKNI